MKKNLNAPFAAIIIFLFVTIISCNTKTTIKEKLQETDSAKTSQPSVSKADSSTLNISNQKNNNNITKPSKNTLTSDDFTILSATSRKWTGGIKGSGSGINYQFLLLANYSSSELIIDQLWIDTTFHEIQVKKFRFYNIATFSKNDTLIIYANDYFASPDRPKFSEEEKQTEVSEKANIKPPYNYASAALVGYKIKGVRKYATVSGIKKLAALNHP